MLLLAAETIEAGEVEKEMGKLAAYLNEHIPSLVNFGVRVVIAIVVFLVGMKLIKWIRKLVRRPLERAEVDKGIIQFLDALIKVALYALLIFSIAMQFGVDAASVAALISSLGLSVGLAAQDSLGNFAGGVLILCMKPFVVGDYIIEDTNKNEGTVTEISLFYTTLLTVDNRTIIVPNGTLANRSLTNVTAQEERRLEISVGIGYRSDLKLAKQTLAELFLAEPAVKKDEEFLVFVNELGENSVVLTARAWVATDDYWPAKWRLNERIKLAFDEKGIEIPVKQVDVTLR